MEDEKQRDRGVGEKSSNNSSSQRPNRRSRKVVFNLHRRAFLRALASGGAAFWGTASLTRAQTAEKQTSEKKTIKNEQAEDVQLQANWPGFRGPFGLAVCAERKPPLTWNGKTGKNVRWKWTVPLPGKGSAVVWKKRVALTGADEQTRKVWCLEADTGRVLWERSVPEGSGSPSKMPEVLPTATLAPASPACDAQHLVVLFADANLACFDWNGKLLWTRNVGPVEIDYVFASSPLLYNGRVYVQIDDRKQPRLLALDVKNGRELWRVERRKLRPCWCSPVVVRHNGRTRLVTNGNPRVAAYELNSGREEWQTKCMGGELAPSPAFADGVVAVAQEYERCAGLDVQTGRLLWKNEEVELPDAASPVAAHGLLFVPTGFGVFSCLRLKDGKLLWSHEFEEGGYSSPVVVNDLLFWTTASGKTYIMRAAQKFELLAEAELGEPSQCTPAFVGDRVFLRGEKHLFCLEPQ